MCVCVFILTIDAAVIESDAQFFEANFMYAFDNDETHDMCWMVYRKALALWLLRD